MPGPFVSQSAAFGDGEDKSGVGSVLGQGEGAPGASSRANRRGGADEFTQGMRGNGVFLPTRGKRTKTRNDEEEL